MAFENLKKAGIKILLGLIKRDFLQIKDAVKTVNHTEADENGDISIVTVPYAQNLETELAQRTTGTYIARTAGGAASIEDGDAWLMSVKGNNVHEGYVAESLEMTVTPIDLDAEDAITATIDRAAFIEACSNVTGTYTFSYTDAWDVDPSSYGITVSGTPADGDTIEVDFVAEERGTIYPAQPNGLIVTGWNLFDYTNGYARVLKYSEDPSECFGISGTYTSLAFSETLDGAQTAITVTDGLFTVPSDGYVWVTGGNNTDTAIWMTWDDWSEGYEGSWEAYTVDEVDFSNEMSTYFPNGLLKAGSAVDEINLNIGQAISRVERLDYSAANRAAAAATGRQYEFDEDYIYLERETPVSNSISVSGAVTVDDHGLELISQTDIPVTVEMLYGNNLKNKLERNVVTISQQSLTTAQQAQIRENIGAASAAVVGEMISNIELVGTKTAASGTNTNLMNIVLDKGVYVINSVASFSANGSGLRQLFLSYSSAGSLINRFAVFQNSPTSSGSATRISLTTILDIAADDTAVYLVGLQTSGSSLTVDGIGMQAVRIK